MTLLLSGIRTPIRFYSDSLATRHSHIPNDAWHHKASTAMNRPAQVMRIRDNSDFDLNVSYNLPLLQGLDVTLTASLMAHMASSALLSHAKA